jgi:hypothetical protein
LSIVNISFVIQVYILEETEEAYDFRKWNKEIPAGERGCAEGKYGPISSHMVTI